MATLSIADRTRVWRGMMRYLSRHPEIPWLNMSKFDLYNPSLDTGAIDETDDWIEGHRGDTGDTTGYNGALADPFKTNASLELKTLTFCAVAAARVSIAFLRQLLGEVD